MEIFEEWPGDFYWCPGDISLVSWRYLMGVLDIFDRCLEIFDSSPGDI